jgi:hypothetical protein
LPLRELDVAAVETILHRAWRRMTLRRFQKSVILHRKAAVAGVRELFGSWLSGLSSWVYP